MNPESCFFLDLLHLSSVYEYKSKKISKCMKYRVWTESYFPVLTRSKCWGNSSNVWEDVFCVLSRIWLWYNSTCLGLKCQRVFAGKNFVPNCFRYQAELQPSQQKFNLKFQREIWNRNINLQQIGGGRGRGGKCVKWKDLAYL